MMDLDTRARTAADGLRQTVASADLALATPPGDRARPGLLHPMWSLAAGAMAAMVLLIGLWMVRPTVVADDADEYVVPTSVPATAVASTEPTASTTPPTGDGVSPVVTSTTATVGTTPPTTADLTPPFIEITTPTDGQVFEEKTITFAGLTEPGARVMAGPYEATVDDAGRWSIVLVLAPGTNKATFVATDGAGNEASVTVSPVYTPPTTVAERAAFVAKFTYGECAETPPYDVYFGEGEPGTEVIVSSDYGGGSTVVGPDGGWELRVEFPEAPVGKAFVVKARDSLGRSKLFEFVYTGPK